MKSNLKKNITRKNKNKHKHIKNNDSLNNGSLKNFEKEVTLKFLEILLMVKLFHWKTTSYATHKATDELYTKLNENIDSFIEVLLGKSGSRIDLLSHKTIRLADLTTQETLRNEVDNFKTYLISLNNHPALNSGSMLNADLFNIRDTILGDMNQFLYLLTFN